MLDPVAELLPLNLLDPEDGVKQINALKRLKKFVNERKIILFAGAGTSQSIGYPGWEALLANLEELAIQSNNAASSFNIQPDLRQSDPLLYADQIFTHFELTNNHDQYMAHICSTFGLREIPKESLPRKLIRLNPTGIVTTNYDLVLEECLQDNQEPRTSDISAILEKGKGNQSNINDFFELLDGGSCKQRIMHIHGSVQNSSSIILTQSEYDRIYKSSSKGEWTVHKRFLWALLATRRVLFVGFSLQDPKIVHMLKEVTKDIWAFENDKHYALMSITEATRDQAISQAKIFKSEYGISCIFYERLQKPSAALENIIDYLASSSDEVEPQTIGSLSPAPSTNWIDETTQKMLGDE